jgi:hypothetical protein
VTLPDFALAAFVLCNGGRIIAYLPQIICAARDRNGATAVSLTTWSLFAIANLSTASYAMTRSGDMTLAWVFSLNAFFCLVIVAITAWKRLHHSRSGERRMMSQAGAEPVYSTASRAWPVSGPHGAP